MHLCKGSWLLMVQARRCSTSRRDINLMSAYRRFGRDVKMCGRRSFQTACFGTVSICAGRKLQVVLDLTYPPTLPYHESWPGVISTILLRVVYKDTKQKNAALSTEARACCFCYYNHTKASPFFFAVGHFHFQTREGNAWEPVQRKTEDRRLSPC
jgi:hypothetical protein